MTMSGVLLIPHISVGHSECLIITGGDAGWQGVILIAVITFSDDKQIKQLLWSHFLLVNLPWYRGVTTVKRSRYKVHTKATLGRIWRRQRSDWRPSGNYALEWLASRFSGTRPSYVKKPMSTWTMDIPWTVNPQKRNKKKASCPLLHGSSWDEHFPRAFSRPSFVIYMQSWNGDESD